MEKNYVKWNFKFEGMALVWFTSYLRFVIVLSRMDLTFFSIAATDILGLFY